MAAPVLLAVPAPVWVRWPAALLCGGTGVANLVPHHFRDGRASDGAVLASLPAQRKAEVSLRRLTASPGWQDRADAADRLLAGYQRKAPEALGRIDAIAVLLRKNGRVDDLLAFHGRDFLLSDKPSPAAVVVVHRMERAVLTVAGVPQLPADLAARRLDWVLRHSAADTLYEVHHTLALAWLHQRR